MDTYTHPIYDDITGFIVASRDGMLEIDATFGGTYAGKNKESGLRYLIDTTRPEHYCQRCSWSNHRTFDDWHAMRTSANDSNDIRLDHHRQEVSDTYEWLFEQSLDTLGEYPNTRLSSSQVLITLLRLKRAGFRPLKDIKITRSDGYTIGARTPEAAIKKLPKLLNQYK
jgi:hypothetical protein